MNATAASETITIPVRLEERSYDILVGRNLLATAGDHLSAFGAKSVAIVTDDHVAKLYARDLEASLSQKGLRVETFAVAPGERSKDFSTLTKVCDAIIAAKIERDDFVIAFGGGVVGDLAGFAAAIVRRGLRFIQIPTTLLAQVDSSVGGKTGINSAYGKNLVGAFHQPHLVLADTGLLDSLPAREMRAGYAEVVKYGLIDDAAFFDWCEENWQGIFKGTGAREIAVAKSCRAKAGVVARDEREQGDRALLNLGHTFGHALERMVGYDPSRLVHGEGVALGMCLAFRFSERLEICPPGAADRIAAHLAKVGLPTRLAQIPGQLGTLDEMLDAMAQDKKVKGGALTFILARGIGQSFIAPHIPVNDVREFLHDEMTSTIAA